MGQIVSRPEPSEVILGGAMKEEPSSNDFEIVVAGAGRVLGDQDGPPERVLKSRLSLILNNYHEIVAAYLVRIVFEQDPEQRVMLCLVSTAGTNEKAVRQITTAFKELFTCDTQMDILFLPPREEAEVVGSCRAFFDRRRTRDQMTGLFTNNDQPLP